MMLRRAALVLALSVAAVAAHAGLFDDDEARQEILKLQKLVAAQKQRLDERLDAVEAEARDRRAVLDLASQIEQLRGELAKMRGQLELLANQAENADKRQKDLYLDIDARLRKLEQAREEQAKAAEKSAAGPAEPAAAEAKALRGRVNQFKLGNYPLAISAFSGFLVTYPSSPSLFGAVLDRQRPLCAARLQEHDRRAAEGAHELARRSQGGRCDAEHGLGASGVGRCAGRTAHARGAGGEVPGKPCGGKREAAPRPTRRKALDVGRPRGCASLGGARFGHHAGVGVPRGL